MLFLTADDLRAHEDALSERAKVIDAPPEMTLEQDETAFNALILECCARTLAEHLLNNARRNYREGNSPVGRYFLSPDISWENELVVLYDHGRGLMAFISLISPYLAGYDEDIARSLTTVVRNSDTRYGEFPELVGVDVFITLVEPEIPHS